MTRPTIDTVISCPAPYGRGGLGRHLAELMGVAPAGGTRYFATATQEDDPRGEEVPLEWLPRLTRWTPVRFRPDWQSYLGNREFDRAVAARLPRGRTLTAFAGAALCTFHQARRLGYAELHLESPTAHVQHARLQYDAARRMHPLERDWLGHPLLARTVEEYGLADVIWVNSEYARATFAAAGVPASKLRRRVLQAHPQFQPTVGRAGVPGLRIVYAGGLTVAKGVPVLIEAFRRIRDPAARLTLVGGTGSRGMARFLAAAVARDPRITAGPGNPLAHYQNADVYVHPSYSDGFGYAPAEALACGVPVVVTEHTGMKELVRPGENGFIVPSGDVGAVCQHLGWIGSNDIWPGSGGGPAGHLGRSPGAGG